MKMLLKTQILRQSGEEIQWAEFSYRAVLHRETGYRVALAAIVIPSLKITVAGASACSPEDAGAFNRHLAADRAMGRARQVATWFVTAKNDNWRGRDTLLGPAGACILNWFPDQKDAISESLQITLIKGVVMHAVDQAVEKVIVRLKKDRSPVARRLVALIA